MATIPPTDPNESGEGTFGTKAGVTTVFTTLDGNGPKIMVLGLFSMSVDSTPKHPASSSIYAKQILE